MPAARVPSRPNRSYFLKKDQSSTSPVATTDRIAACITTDTSAAISLIVTC